jgi:hypothetical protein
MSSAEVRLAAAVNAPATVALLLRTDPRGALSRYLLGANAEEFAQQHFLGIHADVRFQFRFPPAVGSLQGKQVVASALQRRCG